MTAAQVLAIARGDLGTAEDPPGSNRTPFGARFGTNGVPWCAIWIWDVCERAGQPLPFKTAYTPAAANWFRDHGRWGDHPRVGALVFFDFPHDGLDRISHVGLVEAVRDGSIVTLEANTSAGTGGSQRDGGGVHRRTRSASIVGYGYPPYLAVADPAPVAPAQTAPLFPLLFGYYFGPAAHGNQSVSNTIRPRPGWVAGLKMWQSQMRARGWTITPSGRYDSQTCQVTRQFQTEKGLDVDGLIGPVTWRAAWQEPIT